MFLKTKKSLLCLLALLFVMVFAAVGATGLTQIGRKAHAYSTKYLSTGDKLIVLHDGAKFNATASNTYDGSFARHKLNVMTGWTTDWGTNPNNTKDKANDNIRTMVSDFYGVGSLASYITTPAKVTWQANSGYLKNDHMWNASDASVKGTSENYPCDWGNDNVWLPSIYEVKDNTLNDDGTTVSFADNGGLWQVKQGDVCNVANIYSHLRSGNPATYSTAYQLHSNGEDVVNHTVSNFYCIRPAIHLNLSVVADEIAPKLFEVTFGDTTTAYSTVEEAFAAANNAGTATIKMLADAEISETLTVTAGNNITLDLNGHKLALKADKIGSVIEVGGTFTLNDDKTNTDYNTMPHTIASPVTDENIQISGGLITGGNTSGIRVNGSAIFTMTGGTVAGNTATSSSGGGVYINGGGAIVMSNGVITHNKADSAGGGVYMYQNSEFTMNGGEITHNQSGNMAGAGVYVYRCTFHLSGNVRITDNAYKIGLASNVCLVDGVIGSSVIYVDGEIADGSKIGVDSSGACISNYKQSDKPSKFFIPDYANYHCVYVSNKTDGAVTVGSHKGGTATCTQKAVCTNCGEQYGEVDGTKHTPDADDGDCTTALTCKECSAVITAACASHLWSISYRYDDTHHWLKCDREGCTQTAAKFTHAYGIWQTETAATCSEKGIEKRNCTQCNHYETRETEIDEKAHSFGTWQNGAAATCTATGTKAHKDCSVCNKHFDVANSEITDLTIAALGHSWVDPEWTWDDDGKTASVRFICARDGTHTHAINGNDVTIASEVKIAATCTEKGTTAYTAKVTLNGTEYTDTKDVADIEIIAHSYGDWTTLTAATCSSEGSKKHICSVCGHEENEAIAIDENAHGFGEWTVVKQSTLDEFGEEKRVCSHDGTHIEIRQLPKRIPQLVKPDENGGENRVVVTLPDGFAPDVELLVTEISEDNYGNYESVAQTVNGEVGLVYDVTLKSNGVSVQPDGTLTIKLFIPQNLAGKGFRIFHLHDGTATDTEYTVDGNYAVVTTDRLSEFIFIGEKSAPDAFNPLWLILIIIVSLIIVGEIGFIVYGKVRKNKAAEDKE